MPAKKELAHWLKLQLDYGLSQRKICTIISTFGTAEAAAHANHSQLKKAGLSEADLAKFSQRQASGLLDQTLDWAAKDQHHILTLNDPRYPAILKSIDYPPAILYIQGNIDCICDPQLAMVGSRNPTESGKETAFEFAKYLSMSGLIITSGLALGIDAACHKGALSADSATIAVVATGLDQVYPAKHVSLHRSILEKNGAIISEFPLGTKPRPELFPQRNRIISGLSLGTLVIEAALKSGSLITARHAIEQSREVFAIPGSIHNPLAHGCHKLIREGAKLVENAQDILEELAPDLRKALSQFDTEKVQAHTKNSDDSFDDDYRLILDKMGFEPISVDELISRSQLPAENVASMLMILELNGIIAQNHDGRYNKLANTEKN